MSSSVFCIEQRQLAIQQTRKWLTYGLIGSIAVHGGLALALSQVGEKSIVTETPIELIIIEESQPKVPEKPRAIQPTPPPLKPLPKAVTPAPAIATPPSQPKSIQPIQPKQTVTAAPPRMPAVTSPPRVEAKVAPPELPIIPPVTPPVAVPEPSIIPPVVVPEPPVIPSVAVPKSIIPPLAKKPIITDPSPTTQAAVPPDAIATSTPPLVNRTTQAIKNSPSQNREQLKASLGNQSTSSPTTEANPDAIATSTPPRINRSTGAIKNSNSQNREQLKAGFGNPSQPSQSTEGSKTPTAVAANRGVPSRPEAKPKPSPPAPQKEITCIANCQPSYPSVLKGAEGRAAVKVTVDSGGNVSSVTLVSGNSDSQINREALLAARKMRFSNPPNGKSASVQISVNFAVAGLEFDRQARERREQQEQTRLAREREKKENQAQLEQERQERQRKLQQEQKERQAQLEKERQERQRQLEKPVSSPSPTLEPTENSDPTVNSETNNEINEIMEKL